MPLKKVSFSKPPSRKKPKLYFYTSNVYERLSLMMIDDDHSIIDLRKIIWQCPENDINRFMNTKKKLNRLSK